MAVVGLVKNKGETISTTALESCPICGQASQRLFEKYSCWLRGCADCQHRFAEYLASAEHAKDVYDGDYFFGGGDGYADYLIESTPLVKRGEFYGRLVKERIHAELNGSTNGSVGSVLDVGSAAGFLLEGLRCEGWNGRGLDPNSEIVEVANRLWPSPVVCGTLEDYESEDRFDLVTMVQVVAHFHDVRQAFEKAASLTKDRGCWLIETWDSRSLTARLFGRHWHEYSPPSVLHCFSRRSLIALADQCGMEPVADGRRAKMISGSHGKSLLRHMAKDSWLARGASAMATILPDRMLIPYPSEDLFWMLFQKK